MTQKKLNNVYRASTSKVLNFRQQLMSTMTRTLYSLEKLTFVFVQLLLQIRLETKRNLDEQTQQSEL